MGAFTSAARAANKPPGANAMRIALLTVFLLPAFLAGAQSLPAGTPIREVLQAIAARYDVNLAYGSEAVADRALKAPYRLRSLQTDLPAVLRPEGLRFERVGAQYVITVARVRPISVSGFVEDRQTGERLVGATVYALSATRGGSSNGYGFFSLTELLPDDRLVFQYVGYASDTLPARELAAGPKPIRLRPNLRLSTVEITEQVTSSDPLPVEGVALSPKLLDRTQLLNGQRDINSWLAHRAGVTSAANGYRGYGLRGADPEHNLTLLDDANLYLPSHAVGFFSIVPGAAVRSWRLYRDAGPARYGDRVGGVLDIRLKEGNRRERAASLDFGISDVTATTEGPLGNGSYFVSGRRALSDFWLDILRPDDRLRLESRPEVSFGFFDVAAKVNQRIGERQQLYASVFVGRDRYCDAARAFSADATELRSFTDRSRRVWQNVLGSVRHSVVLGDRWFANSTLTASDFNVLATDDVELRVTPVGEPDSARVFADTTVYDSRISDLGFKSDLQHALSPEFLVTLGVDATLHRFALSSVSLEAFEDFIGDPRAPTPTFTLDFSAYLSFDFRPSERFTANFGLRLSSQLSQWSPQLAPLPRGRVDYRLTDRLRAFGTFAMARQYVHRLSTNNPGLPRDLWVPTIRGLRPLASTQASGGLAYAFAKTGTISINAYGATLRGLTRLDNDFLGSNYRDWIDNVREGWGTSYGAEVEANYELPQWAYGVSYTYGRSTRRFEDLSGRLQAVERARLDRRHAIAATTEYRPGKRWTILSALRFGTGLPARRPFRPARFDDLDTGLPLTNGWSYEGAPVLELRPFFSLDLGFRFRPGSGEVDQELSLGAQNVTSHRNPLFFNVRTAGEAQPGQGLFENTEVFAPPTLPYLRFVRRF